MAGTLRMLRNDVNANCVTLPASLLWMEDLPEPSDRIRWARINKGKFESATAAANAHGWVVPTYLGHENGDRNPSREAAKKYGAAYGVPWEWILEGGPLPDKRRRPATIPTRGEVAAGRWLDLDVELDVIAKVGRDRELLKRPNR